MSDRQDLILNFSSPDRPGILAAVTDCVFRAGWDIRDAQQYGDPDTRRFFIRLHLAGDPGLTQAALAQALEPVAQALEMSWSLWPWQQKLRTLILVSRFQHCLNDLLHRWHAGLLHTDIAGVVSNHTDCQRLVEWHGLPFHHLPVTPDNKAQQEARLGQVIEQTGTDLVVLARYMQVLSPELCSRLAGRCINIHHSFLPSFKGAQPYRRAYERGVKLVGATAHYVTADLDEGPIIEQDVVRVNHSMNADEMTHLGREVEARVLARAVRWHVEHRVILNGRKTIVFE